MIYICIPAHNEERTVGVLLWKIRQVMASFPRDYQILVVNDGSTDATSDVLGPYQRVMPLTVIQLEKKRGYAHALELLLREAVRRAEYPKRDVIVTLQADFTDDPDEVLGLLKRIEAGADIVSANAVLPEQAPRALRWGRKVGNFLLKRRGWPEGVTDPLSGLRAYRVMVVKRALEGRSGKRLLTWDGWAANAQLLQEAQPHSRRTESLDCHWRGDRQQRTTRHTLWPLLGSMLRFSRGGAGPLEQEPLHVPSAVDMRERRKPGGRRPPQVREAVPEREAASRPRRTRSGSRNGRAGQDTEGRPQRPQRERPEGSRRGSRPERGAAPQRERPPRRERPAPARGPEGNGVAPSTVVEESADGEAGLEQAPRPKRKRRRRGSGKRAAETRVQAVQLDLAEDTPASETVPEAPEDGQGEEEAGALSAPRKRRSRRGGRGRRGRGRAGRPEAAQEGSAPEAGPDQGPHEAGEAPPQQQFQNDSGDPGEG